MLHAVGGHGDFVGHPYARGGFQAGVNANGVQLHTGLAFKVAQQDVGFHHIGGRFHFGQQDAVEAGAGDGFQVKAGQPGFQAVDADEQGLAAGRQFVNHPGHQRAGGFLVDLRHGILEVKDKRIGAVLGRFPHPVLLVAGDEHHGAQGLGSNAGHWGFLLVGPVWFDTGGRSGHWQS